jgi:hypothetical protein
MTCVATASFPGRAMSFPTTASCWYRHGDKVVPAGLLATIVLLPVASSSGGGLLHPGGHDADLKIAGCLRRGALPLTITRRRHADSLVSRV